MLRVLQGAARFRSTSTIGTSPTSCATCATTPIWSPCSTTTTHRVRRHGRVAESCGVVVVAGSDEYEQLVRDRLSRTRPRSALSRRPTTCSTPAAPPAGRRASCGARRTCSSAGSAAGIRAVRRSPSPSRSSIRVLGNPAQRLRPFLPRRRHQRHPVRLARARSADAPSGQWSALGSLLGGGKVVLYGEPHVDMELVLDLIERERVQRVQPRGRRERRVRCSTRSPRNPNRWDLSALRLLGSGGSIMSGEVKDGLMRRAAVGARDRRGHRLFGVARAGRRGHDAQRRAVGVTHIHGEGRHDRRRRRASPGRAGQRRGRPARDSRPRSARLLQGSRSAARARS